ncbi:tetratricopeptide repeat protein [Tenacibaculum adriaticum]|uniref:tetratricopeptide repeat protein n=1 Tax=Tenacibaculum adriaticum TaxID=413713 RepID=UPI001478968A|nr:tetratricopeptide repeat protein [Tenacibaculum adriaticum]
MFFNNANGQSIDLNTPFYKETDSILLNYKKELELAKKKDSNHLIAEKRQQLGHFYYDSGLYTEAINQYNKSLELINSLKVGSLHILLNNDIGRVYLSMNNYSSAETFFKDALQISKKLNLLKGQADSQGLLGATYEKKGEYLKALEYQRKSLSLFEILKDSTGIALINENIGSIYEDLIQYDKAHNYFIKAYRYLKDTKTHAEINVLNNLGDVYRKKGEYDESILYTKKALELAIIINDDNELESAYKDMSKAYALVGNYEKAFEFLKKSERLKEEILNNQNAYQLNALQTAYDSNKKEAQIRLLEEKNKVNQANQKVLIVILISILSIILILLRYFNKKRKANLKLQDYKQRTLKAELDKKEIEEKNLQRDNQLKTASLSKYSLHLSQKNKILSDISTTLKNIATRKNIDYNSKLKELAKEIDFNLQQESEWVEFKNLFEDIHPDFIKKLSSVSVDHLSPAELKLGMLLRLNLSSKKIASVLRVTPDSVRVARYRLRKKLPIDQKKELVSFMLEL